MLKLFVQDNGYRGMMIAIAYTELEARNLMKLYSPDYNESEPVEVREITYGLVVYNLGDC